MSFSDLTSNVIIFRMAITTKEETTMLDIKILLATHVISMMIDFAKFSICVQLFHYSYMV